MKTLILLAIVGFIHVSEARMNAFACSGECYPYDYRAYCISNGSVACNNCARDAILCADTSLTSSTNCDSDACD